MTSACDRFFADWPSSWASEKLIASIRSVYSWLSETSEKRPMRWFDVIPNSASSGSMKVLNMSRTSPWAWSLTIDRISVLTRVMKTMGFLPSRSAVWLISRTTWCALSGVSMNGRRRWRGLIANCDRIELPKVSAVMPVPSETKNTVWRGIAAAAGPAALAAAEEGAGSIIADDRQAPVRATSARRIGRLFDPAHARRLSPPPPRRSSFGRGLAAVLRSNGAFLRRRCGSDDTGSSQATSPAMSSTHLATAFVARFDTLRMTDVEAVGGKNASLGEMISQLSESGVRVPGGFATTAHAFRTFLAEGGLARRISERLAALDTDDVRALAEAGAEIRGWIEAQPLPAAFEAEVRREFERLSADHPGATFAVRSSATAEDLPEASFAGQQETYLNVSGIDDVLAKMREVFASLYNDRAISYRVHKGYAHGDVALSAGVQRMVRSDLGAAGVMFTIDTESGFSDVVFITASYGLGETVVQGAVNPDEFYVYKPGLRAGKKSILRRNLGGKAIKMVYAEPGSGERVKTVDVAAADRQKF